MINNYEATGIWLVLAVIIATATEEQLNNWDWLFVSLLIWLAFNAMICIFLHQGSKADNDQE